MHPTMILLVGMATILAGIVLLRLNAFLALIIAAIVVSLLAPGEPAVKIARVAEGFGRTAGTVGIVIALAAIIGKAMTDSGAADRIVNAFLALLGEKRGATALCSTGYILSIPVFFDTVFYLLVPLARSMYGRTNRNYLKYLLAIAAGAGATHTLVPPTPGPLAIAGTLGVDLGTMVLVGIVVALPAAGAGLLFAGWVDRRMPVVPRAPAGSALGAGAAEAAVTQPLPGLVPSLLPIILPVLLISSHTVVVSMTARPGSHVALWSALAPYTAIIGNPNLALLVAVGIAMWVLIRDVSTISARSAAQGQPCRPRRDGGDVPDERRSDDPDHCGERRVRRGVAGHTDRVRDRADLRGAGGRVGRGLRPGLSIPRVRGREPDETRPRLEHRRDDHDRGHAGGDAAGERPAVSHGLCRHRDCQRVARRDVDERQRLLAVFEDGRRDGDRDPQVVDPGAGDRRSHGHGDHARARAAGAAAVAFGGVPGSSRLAGRRSGARRSARGSFAPGPDVHGRARRRADSTQWLA